MPYLISDGFWLKPAVVIKIDTYLQMITKYYNNINVNFGNRSIYSDIKRIM